ncbi:XRE family transcriptional regulator [Streptomyces sp. XM4193]|uniref:helix-turn-helix domain-containing protein n=1 Tax=Streptomyces sp. XM4193 TaxID=2929782 RepID=UPI001FF9D193|nr:XRE family transcriptional regulator [Streptomyces sp. XM4193]MCK1794897.1 XRE family transcriptional regulator [Streptomyces sp. XM4193]
MSADRPVEYARLAALLRELRERTGLSLAALGERTPYSKSSWGRYLSGSALPPREAVEALCALASVRPGKALAYWELAETAWRSRAGADGPLSERLSPDGPSSGRLSSGGPSRVRVRPPEAGPSRVEPVAGAEEPVAHRRFGLAGAAVAAVAALIAAGLLLTGALDGLRGDAEEARVADGDAGTTASPGQGATGSGLGTEADFRTSCTEDTCTGKDPEVTRCSHARIPPGDLGERGFGGETVVKIRQSIACDTVWARIDRGLEGDRVRISAPGQEDQLVEVADRFDTTASVSTPMVAVAESELNEVRVCLIRGDQRKCFHPTV